MIGRWLVLPIAVLAAGAGQSVSERAIDASLHRIYDPLTRDTYRDADWERPVFSRATRKLIRNWQAHIGNTLTVFNDFGWFCSCQDWDAKAFRFDRRSLIRNASGGVEVSVHVTTGWDSFTDQKLKLVSESGRWVIDDMISESMPGGLVAGLKRELAAPADSE